MKTKNVNRKANRIITILIMVLTVSTTLSAQDSLLAQKWNQFRSNMQAKHSANQVEFRTVAYNEGETGIEAWMTDLRTWAADRIHPRITVREEAVEMEGWMATPFVSRSISCSAVEILYEEETGMEGWMSKDWTAVEDENTAVEGWMKEDWTSVKDENIRMESWMSEDWTSVQEEEVEMEAWMSTPSKW